jgi:hypothetical protein
MDSERFVIYMPGFIHGQPCPYYATAWLRKYHSKNNEERANGILNIAADITSLQLLAPKGQIYTQAVYTRPQLFVPFSLHFNFSIYYREALDVSILNHNFFSCLKAVSANLDVNQ